MLKKITPILTIVLTVVSFNVCIAQTPSAENVEQIEQEVMDALLNENHSEFLDQLIALRGAGVHISPEINYYEAQAHLNLRDVLNAHIAIELYIQSPGEEGMRYNEALEFQEYLNSLFEERNLYLQVIESGVADDLKTYLSEYPNGFYLDELKELIDETVFDKVDIMPELIGGMASIANQIQYPEIARRAGISGRVYVRFIVDETGRVTNPTILRGLNDEINEEALRVVRQAQFKPGSINGTHVNVNIVLPINFQLQ